MISAAFLSAGVPREKKQLKIDRKETKQSGFVLAGK